MESKEIKLILDSMPYSEDNIKLKEYIKDIEDRNKQLAAIVAHMAQDISKLSLKLGGAE